jgi:ribosomal protein L11 methyltransferase
MNMTQKEPEKWLKIEITAAVNLIDALSNFLEETGAQGVFSESLLPPGASDFPEQGDVEVIQAFFPADVRSEKRIYTVRKYLKSLEEIFPDVDAPSLTTEIISDPDWGEQWKKYFKPIRVCKNIVVKPTWERYTPASRDIVVEIDPGMAFGTGQHASTRMCMEAMSAAAREFWALRPLRWARRMWFAWTMIPRRRKSRPRTLSSTRWTTVYEY